MKSSISQIMMFTLTILFAVALTLTIAMICLSYAHVDGEDSHILPTVTEESTDVLPPTETETTDNVTSVTEWITTFEETLTETDPPQNTLSFSSTKNGTCSVSGIGTYDEAFLVIPEYSPSGERVTSIEAYAFYACQNITAIQIPSSVSIIGECAFGACPNLIYISVSRDNNFFCDVDGILYTANTRALLCYPPMRAGSTVTIDFLTTEIATMAFYNCAYLTHINYTGSAEQWERIWIGSKNYSLTAASKSFCDGK